ncbi:Oxidoreductase, 2OG-Fe(II) oxygenase family [Rhodotorula toruloides ATCC 204091]|uniref:Oxidoreductase n=1 Tax=Rhodotorula toruloides TaxID=5286 RepID=A0A0K3CBN1_RHOTO|nr:Oxidoreductase, 2OG-Fe(II) oxygenase family [Rhodotorula toruloides ATCC 204091]KAK4334763.1 Oxidoreductase, 2OG-Fe(II) oxygenase family [Rhodotorula toruloides]PRQ76134.1 Oxidoreductase [Rhodotorula toruloides]
MLNTIDLSSNLSGASSPEQDRVVAQAFVDAASQVGFAYVTGWESVVPAELVQEVFEYNERFFDLPQEKKDELEYVSSKANRGYLSFGREQASLSKDPNQIESEREASRDQKETFEIGNDSDPQYPEHWPKEEDLPGFKATMNRFHQLCDQLHLRLMSLLAISLSLPPDFFLPQINGRNHCLRLLHYPPVPRKGSNNRIGAHTDFGTTTLLWQDDTGGLEIEGPNGAWVPVKPKPGTFVVNFGDILARWSNDRLKSTVHRAVLPPPDSGDDEGGMTKTRRSIAYFCNPNPDALISCIPGLEGPSGKAKYEPVVAGDFYAAMLEAEIGV